MSDHRASPMVAFNNVMKTFPDRTVALRGVSCGVDRGEFCVILGSSGAGKSTLLRTVNGLVAPTRGQVWVNGEEVEAKALVRLRPRIGMIHQQFNLSPRLSVAKNVLAGALPAMNTAAALLHLFPSVQRRRACEWIARAFMLDPLVVLADEPVASLDPKTSRDILGLLKQASKERQTTVLCSLHQLDHAREFADRIIGMRAGQILFDGAPETLNDSVLRQIYATQDPVAELHDVSVPHGNGIPWPARA